MESPDVKPPDNVPYCRGTRCYTQADCAVAGACTYRSSADDFREYKKEEQLALDLPTPRFDPELNTHVKKAKDFTGEITGTGYKASMDDPKKIPLALIDPTYCEGVGRVLRHGAKRYAPGNWLNGMSWREVISGMERHLKAIERGEDIDPDTGELHTYHLGCGTMFLSRFMNDPRYEQFDDRMFKGVPCR